MVTIYSYFNKESIEVSAAKRRFGGVTFWWGSSDTTQKIHWQNGTFFVNLRVREEWDSVTFAALTKLYLQNSFGALIIIRNLFCLQFLKRSIRPSPMNCDVLEANVGFDPSYAWRSIWGAKALLLDGLKWRARNDSAISVWRYAWLLGNTSTLVPTSSVVSNIDLRVIDLIDHTCNAVNNTFIAEERPLF
ncbi:uncharacterized protein LOC110709092 [Chenopodium quinoa]|uniref:uncharacterized protein LOC110709092 n=1 Tax=Chenopodium quinoa TaxID=63459 RepID=UPI000B77D73F|nr:uncharacterized protein LOC110709092 [Chenopodium quinoa]